MNLKRGLTQLVRLLKGEVRLPVGKAFVDRISSEHYPSVSLQDFRHHLVPDLHQVGVDLGCGRQPNNFFSLPKMLGIDLKEDESAGVIACDLSQGVLPFSDASVDFVSAYDLVEHIPRWDYRSGVVRFPFVELMTEIHRVLSPGGLFLSFTPAYPSPKAFQDPTHVNIITEDTFPLYFSGSNPWSRPYGFEGTFQLVEQGWQGGHLLTMLAKEAKS